MNKILLVSVNASYMHTNVAIRSLKAYAEKILSAEKISVEIAEFTINQPVGEELRSIGFTEADAVLFSTYIWNAEYVCKLLPEVKKLLPDCILGAGGPEFGYSAEKYLASISDLDFIMFGEGEKTFVELAEALCGGKKISSVKGIYFRDTEGKIKFSGEQHPIENLDELPFAYPEIQKGDFDSDHKIYYYESTRGCPFGCAYCLSSVDKRVRFKSLEKVQQELKIFLDANVKLVKFIDRTYNLNPDRYIPIWKYILENHNGKTMFHFEIEAEYLSDDALAFLQQVPSGVMQFEMGVQSANKKTLKAVNRSDNVELLAEKIRRIPKTIHQHLDLIAGLPYEDLESFGKSFDFVMALKPDALQLGFLKILNGTQMADMASEGGWKWMETPAYETFSTPYLSFRDVAFLKDVEILTDAYWNKEIFSFTMNYIYRKTSPWKFLSALTNYGKEKGTFDQARRDLYWFSLVYDFVNDEITKKKFSELNFELVVELLRYDFVRSGKKGNWPAWYEHIYDKDRHKSLLDENEIDRCSRIKFANSEYEVFKYDVEADFPEFKKGIFEVLIRY
ncbi:B12-binding domain-containing radical SAM protein [Treponema sp.]|uniref:B12-binding domain-containing radical SAM protein n=1 Tax=Treponema sp. TaxID=166 RepID=UPI00298DE401|nr:DUF4080 domain-containing protein [Treponema sp.]MCQ2240931.1 B12-binding domain-containing radical SAM protein [Treponema sp.]